MFIISWLFDKLGYMPKINMEVGVVNQAWPFPAETPKTKPVVAKKPAVKRATTRKAKPAVAAKTARTKKAK